MRATGRLSRAAVGLHRALIRILAPPGFRRERGRDLALAFADQLADLSRRRAGVTAILGASLREIGALVRLAVNEWWTVWAGGRGRAHGDEPMGREWTGMIGQDLKIAARMVARAPLLTAIAVATIGVGVGANAAVFTVVRDVLLETLPYDDPDEVVLLGETTPEGEPSAISYGNFRDWQRSGVFEEVALFAGNSVAVTGEGERPERIRGLFVTASYFPLTGVEPALGRAILPGEDEPHGPRTAVLSHGFWETRYGGDPSVLGRTITLNNEPHTIVGVMPEGFVPVWDPASAWISLQTLPRTLDRSSRSLQALARIREGGTLEGSTRELEALAARLAEAHPDENGGRSAWLLPAAGFLTRDTRGPLLILLAAVAMVLLIACANLAGLQMARASARRREMAIRGAMGGSRARLARQLLVESLVLSLAGGAAALVIAWLGVEVLLDLQPRLRTYYDVSVDAPVLAFTLGLALLTGVLFGLAPALTGSRVGVGDVLREAGRSATEGRRRGRVRGLLVGGQVAVAVTLLVGAGLLLRSMQRMVTLDPGYDPDGLLTLEFRLPANKYETDEAVGSFYRQMLERVEGLPGVEGAAVVGAMPFADGPDFFPFLEEGQGLEEAAHAPDIAGTHVSPGYFDVMGIPLVRGRRLEATDGPGAPAMVVMSRTAAERLVPGRDPIGTRFYYTEALDVATVVGVVGDVRHGVRREPDPLVYFSSVQNPSRFTSVVVRSTGDPGALVTPVRDAIWSLDPDQPVWEVMTMRERMAATLGMDRFFMEVLAAFAASALFLAALGIYGVVSHRVAGRRREIGVRIALGAGMSRVVAGVLAGALSLVLVGVAVGVVAAALLSRTLEAVLFGVEPLDPVTFVVAPIVLAAVALAACLVPALRAARVDPAESLQEA